MRSRALAALAACAAAACGALSVGSAGAEPTDTSIQERPATGQVWVATVLAAAWAHSQPEGDAPLVLRVDPTTLWNTPKQLLVLNSTRDSGGVEWLRVLLDVRPNGRIAWIPARDVVLSSDPWLIAVSRAQRVARVFHNGHLAREFRVVVGKPSTPTPAGLFSIGAELRQPTGGEFVGSWVMPLTAHSEVLRSFDGGDGQVALHGRGGESLRDPLGTARSHGCVRFANSAIDWVASHVPPGTPVRIT